MKGAIRSDEPVFDGFAEQYSRALERGLKISGESETFFAEGRIAWLARLLGEIGSRPLRIADFGCGVGGSIPILREAFGAKYLLGVDISERSLEVARSRQGATGGRFVLPEALEGERDLDLIYTNGVFHHIRPSDRLAVARSLLRALRPSGFLAFWENNPWNPGARLVMKRIPFDRGAVMVSAAVARRFLLAAGFELVRTDFLFLFPRFLSALRLLEPRLSRLPFGAQYLILARARARAEAPGAVSG